MTSESRIKVFKEELNWIGDSTIREFTSEALTKLPDYFFEVAASSTGKYHPSYALGLGGLVRHTKAAVAIAKDLLSLEMYSKFSNETRDMILSVLILHDGMKHGLNGSNYTVANHPVVIANWLVDTMKIDERFDPAFVESYIGAIESHMGQWNTDYKTKEVIMPKPTNAIDKFVHQCDYLASRKYLEVNFSAINYDGDRV